ncbi:MAG: ATP-binding protein, partial [Quisquiliibacterium sp.]
RGLARCLGGAGSTRKTVQLVVQELLFNAIEHGNLGIDYNAKGALLIAGGLEDEIARRLADPDLGSRHVEVTYQLDGQRLSVTITDQGDGFAWDEYLHISDERIFHPHGRGLPMTHSLADELVFTGRGNIVTATWHQPR